MEGGMKRKKSKCVSYAKWGYIFLIPFFLVYIIFQLIPLLSTFYNSFFENYRVGLMQVGPTFVGFKNYKEILFNSELPMYLKNTFIIWMMGFIPQMFFSLLLASWFTDLRLRLKCSGFFKTVIYMPNLIMASAFSMLFYTIFSDVGPINNLLNRDYILEILNTDGSAFSRPWFGQLMTGPQLMAYLCQVNMWLERYQPKIEL